MLKVPECGNADGVVQVSLTALIVRLAGRSKGRNLSWKSARWRRLIRSTGRRCPTANLIDLFLQQVSVRRGDLECVHARVIAQDKAEISRPDYMLHEHARGPGLLVKNPGHTCASIEQHANIEDHIAVVSKELNGLLLPVFQHSEFHLIELAG